MRLIDLNKIPHKAFRGDRDDLVDALFAAPTVDAVPVVHGEWRRIKETGFFKAECSACGKTEYCTSKYCPNCGADMREV